MKTRWLVLSLALAAVAAVAAVVFSSQPGETSHGVSRGIILWILDWLHWEVSEEALGWINYFLRRGAHLTIYFCMSLGLALAFQWQKKMAPWIPAMVFGVVFAVSDELHQFYTGNRTASPGDVLLDSVGLAAGCAAAWFLRRCWEKRHTKP